MSDINAISSEEFGGYETDALEEQASTSWNGRTVSFTQRATKAFPIFEHLQVVRHMERVRQPRSGVLETKVEHKNGKMSANVSIDAPSDDGKDNISVKGGIDQDGNFSAEANYKLKFGGKKEREDTEKE